MARRTLALVVLLGVGALATAGCGGDSGVSAGAAEAAGTVPPTVQPSTTGTTGPGTTTPVTSSPRPTTTTPPSTTTTPTDSTAPLDDAVGLGDEPFPELGNPGLDVTHYDVALDWDPDTERLAGTITLDLTFTQARPAFTLDAEGTLDITEVLVDGAAVKFDHDVPELVVVPDTPLAAGQEAQVTVTYTATVGGGDSAAGLPGGWLVTDIGAYTLCEPDLARTWMPANDHPSDKATWTFHLTVPDGQTAVANGVLTGGAPADGVWTWEMDEPMATYLIGIVIGPYQHVTGTTAAGLALSSAVLPEDLATVQPYLDEIGPMIDYFDDWFGPYPFESYGLSLTDSVPGLAMEQQTRSLIPRTLFEFFDEFQVQAFLSHELAHQWFGNAVTPGSWQDIWLNEGFATYAQWMWSEHKGLEPLASAAENALAGGRRVNTGEPGFDLFSGEVYSGGGVVLHALRRTIGDDAFFETLRRWVADNEGTSRTTTDFIAVAEAVSGQDLDALFEDWLYTTDTPDRYP